MAISVRLDEKTESLLNKTVNLLKTTKSEVIKDSIQSYCENTLQEMGQRPYDLISDLIGDTKSGKGNLSVDVEKIFREKFRKKR